jgi:hypothetical protein
VKGTCENMHLYKKLGSPTATLGGFAATHRFLHSQERLLSIVTKAASFGME